ncbi:MAG: VOC family protein [Planctomycetota bacterium]
MKDPSWLGIRHVALRVHNLEGCLRFYSDFLGFSIEWQPDPDSIYLTTGQDNLALHRDDSMSSRGERSQDQALDHFGFVLTDIDAVDGWAQRAEEFGVEIVQGLKTHRDGARSFYMLDPDGNKIQILYHPPLSHLPGGRGDKKG